MIIREAKEIDGEAVWNKLLAIAEENHIEVYEINGFPEQLRGVYFQFERLNIIGVNVDFEIDQLVFTLAHELGHYKLHSGRMQQDRYWTCMSYTDKIEREADKFAKKLITLLERGIDPEFYKATAHFIKCAHSAH